MNWLTVQQRKEIREYIKKDPKITGKKLSAELALTRSVAEYWLNKVRQEIGYEVVPRFSGEQAQMIQSYILENISVSNRKLATKFKITLKSASYWLRKTRGEMGIKIPTGVSAKAHFARLEKSRQADFARKVAYEKAEKPRGVLRSGVPLEPQPNPQPTRMSAHPELEIYIRKIVQEEIAKALSLGSFCQILKNLSSQFVQNEETIARTKKANAELQIRAGRALEEARTALMRVNEGR